MLPTKTRMPAGRYPRGEETKRRIIDAAVEIFGRQGFAGTSTRDIVAAAEVNTPAIQYYFGNKAGLYDACIDQLTGMVWRRIAPAVQACRASVEAGASLDELISALGELQDCLIDSFFSDDEGYAIRRLLAWQDAENGDDGSDRLMKERIALPTFQTFQTVIETVAGSALEPIQIRMHALSLMGLTMVFHFNQSRVAEMLNCSTQDDEWLASLKLVARKQVAYALIGLSRGC